jgi:hypothetical protein
VHQILSNALSVLLALKIVVPMMLQKFVILDLLYYKMDNVNVLMDILLIILQPQNLVK